MSARWHADVYKFRGRWHAEVRTHHVGWTDTVTSNFDSYAVALAWAIRMVGQ